MIEITPRFGLPLDLPRREGDLEAPEFHLAPKEGELSAPAKAPRSAGCRSRNSSTRTRMALAARPAPARNKWIEPTTTGGRRSSSGLRATGLAPAAIPTLVTATPVPGHPKPRPLERA